MPIHERDAVTLAEFEAWIDATNHLDQRFEWIGGEIVEVPSNPYVSKVAGWILTAINLYLLMNDIGHSTGESGGYIVNGERYAPDVAFISYERQPELTHIGYNPQPPNLAVEVISNPDNREEQANLRRKLANYLAADVMVWIVNPYERWVEVYQWGKPVEVLEEDDLLLGRDILPGFTLPVSAILPKRKSS